MVVTLSNDEESYHRSNSDQEGKFMAFIATTVVDDESPSNE